MYEPSRGTSSRLLSRIVTTAVLLSTLSLGHLAAQSPWTVDPWVRQASNDCPPFVFVTLSKSHDGFGIDAQPQRSNGAGRLELGSPGRELWYMHPALPDPVKLFPLAAHVAKADLRLNLAPLDHGSVHEPSVYHHTATDQYWVFFSYATDLLTPYIGRPCDIYAMNITQAVMTPDNFSHNDLPVVRLTDAVAGTPQQQSQLEAEVYARSFNPELMPQHGTGGLAWVANGIGVQFETNTGACVVDEEHGPVLYYASNERRCDGEGMMAAELVFTPTSVSMRAPSEVMQFATTSMISFFEMPRGAGGSYRSSTDTIGQWGIFELRSDESEWQTVSGYANQQNIADHNGTTVAIGSDPNDSLLAISRYYISNNEGFGTVVVLPYDEIGLNDDDGNEGIRQRGHFNGPGNTTNLFPEIPEFSDDVETTGKFALPASGRRSDSASSVQLFLTYSSGPAHDVTFGGVDYDAELIVVTDISAPIDASGDYWSGMSATKMHRVLRHEDLHCFGLRPVLTHQERFGFKHNIVQPLPSRLDPTGLPAGLVDMPVAQVTAGPVYDTDVRAMSRRKGGYYDPTTEARNNAGTDHLAMRVSCLTKDVDPSYFKIAANQPQVWGVRVFATDSMVRKLLTGPATTAGSHWGYLHHNGDGNEPFGKVMEFERFRHLGDVKADSEGMVNFYVPANVPMKFFLLHKDGTALALHRNHHNFTTGQLERRCTGCHNHVDPAAGLASSSTAPTDLLSHTPHYTWQPGLNGLDVSPGTGQPSRAMPEFRADIWPILQEDCRGCHESGANPDPVMYPHWGSGIPPQGGFDLAMTGTGIADEELAVWMWLNRMRYVNRRLGAAKSPFSWYFTGLAGDGAERLDGETNQRYIGTLSNGVQTPNGQPSRYWITTSGGPNGNPHPVVLDRTHAHTVIDWIDSGGGIDHGAVDINGNPDPRRGIKGDGYQIALSARLTSWASSTVQIGFWDVDQNVQTINVTLRGDTYTYGSSDMANGVKSHALSLHNLDPAPQLDDVLEIEAIDTAGNRSVLRRTLHRLLLESETFRGSVTLASDGPVYDTSTGPVIASLDVSAGGGFANGFYAMVLSEDLYPPYIAAPATHLYLLPTYDSWFAQSLAAGLYPLDANGNATWTWNLPANAPTLELHAVGLVLGPAGTLAKSNIEAIRIE